ncbi:hypothetical protein DIPPA_05053 [Diplonema papillatum]|nr:hypothetical protein DIPPA_05053 [Diplonema papillatum]
MFRPVTRLLFAAKAECDVLRNGMKIRLKVVPNPVSSYTKLPASAKYALGLSNEEADQTDREQKRKLVGEMLRQQGDGAKRAASVLVEKIRKQQTGKTTDLAGPVELYVVGRGGGIRQLKTFVTFGTEKDQLTPLGNTIQLGLLDLQRLGVAFDFSTNELSFVEVAPAAAPEEPSDPAASSGPGDKRKVAAGDRRLAGQMLPSPPAALVPPQVNPSEPLQCARPA